MSSSIIKQLKAELLADSADLSSILRKAKVLAFELENDELKNWVEKEMNGYSKGSPIPKYRQVAVRSFGDFKVGSYSMSLRKGIPVDFRKLPARYEKWGTTMDILRSVKGVEAMIKDDDLVDPWPRSLTGLLTKVTPHGICLAAWRKLSKASLEELLESVRNRLLNFVLELERISIDSNELSNIPDDAVSMVFNTYITGSHNVVATGQNVKQKVSQKLNSFDDLAKFLMDSGLTKQDVNELKTAIEQDGPSKNELGKNVLKWIGNMVGKAIQGIWTVGISEAAPLLTDAIMTYYGLK